MSDDVKSAVAEAKARWKKVAAVKLMRREELEGIIAAGGAGADEAAEELLVVKGELQTALDEIKALDGLAARAPAVEARAIAASIEGDPVIQSYEEAALDRARDYVKELNAQVRLNDELGGPEGGEERAAPKVMSKEEADTKARAEFEERRKASKKTL